LYINCCCTKPPVQDNDYKPTVSVTTKKNRDHIDITVKDNGMGIPF
jgi:DNA topoisomerase VI subunit B